MRTAWLGLSVFYTAVIVYGSLVPFDYDPLSMAEAWERGTSSPVLDTL